MKYINITSIIKTSIVATMILTSSLMANQNNTYYKYEKIKDKYYQLVELEKKENGEMSFLIRKERKSFNDSIFVSKKNEKTKYIDVKGTKIEKTNKDCQEKVNFENDEGFKKLLVKHPKESDDLKGEYTNCFYNSYFTYDDIEYTIPNRKNLDTLTIIFK